jgi:predicted TIM-barrel fold metal-dependent hydrolase
MSEAGMAVMIEAEGDGDASLVLQATCQLTMPVILLDVSLRTITEAMSVLRIRPDTYLSTRLLCGGDTMEFLAREVGADRLIFSSRFPISCFSSAFLTATYSAISDAERDAVMGKNIMRILGVKG